jgi:hypothetical protein
MRGMGADAFFGSPVDQQVDEEVNQDTGRELERQSDKEGQRQGSKPLEQGTGIETENHTSIPVNQDAPLPEYQWDGVELESDTDVEVYQQDTRQTKKLTGKSGKKSSGKSVPQTADVETIKASYYVTIEDDLKLESIRLARRKRGIKTDKSALVREAIAKLKE